MFSWLSLWVIPLIGEMSAKQTKGCPFPEEKLAKSKILTERVLASLSTLKKALSELKQKQRDELLPLPLGEVSRSDGEGFYPLHLPS